MEDMLRVGVVTSPHGLNGEVNVYPTTDDARRFDSLEKVFIDAGKGGWRRMEIEHVKYFKNMAIVKFRGHDSIDDAEALRKKELWIPREDAVELADDEYFISDIIGLKAVTDTGETLGSVYDVLQTGANDVYCVRQETGKEILLPAIRDCILDIDIGKGEILVHVMEGLLDI